MRPSPRFAGPVLGASILLLSPLLAACGSGDDDPAPTPSASSTTASATPTPSVSSSPSSTAAPTADPADPVRYDEGEGTVDAPDGADRLPGAPEDFRAFLKKQIEAGAVSNGCDDGVQVTVDVLRPDGWARGSVFEKSCGGYGVLWARVDGDWREVWSGQSLVECAVLERYRFPADVAGDQCYDEKADDAVRYG